MFNKPKALKGRKHKAQQRSAKQESEIAEAISGSMVPGSGTGNQKGDVRVRDLVLIEAKCTEKDSFRVTRKLIEKIQAEAARNSDELPAMVIELMGTPVKRSLKVAVMPLPDLYELIERANNNG